MHSKSDILLDIIKSDMRALIMFCLDTNCINEYSGAEMFYSIMSKFGINERMFIDKRRLFRNPYINL